MVRNAIHADAAAVSSIYEPYVLETAISFETEVVGADDFVARIAASTSFLVCERDGAIAGYAYANQFNPRSAYRWSSEVSIYIDRDHHRAGVGRELLAALLERLVQIGIVNAFAGITLPNVASEGLFESSGFTRVATYEAVGYKLGAWHDVGWWQLRLQPPSTPPPAVS